MTWALWRFLELVLDASAILYDYDAEIADLAMLAALAAADRLALSDEIAYRLRDSALAEVRRASPGERPGGNTAA